VEPNRLQLLFAGCQARSLSGSIGNQMAAWFSWNTQQMWLALGPFTVFGSNDSAAAKARNRLVR